MTHLTTTATDAPDRTRPARAPWTLHLGAALLLVMNLVLCFGAVYFGTHPDPTRPPNAPDPGSWQAWTLIVLLLAYSLAAILSVPGMYRRSRTAWCVALGFLAAHLLFGSLKFFGLGEDAALVFVVVDLLVGAALLSRRTQRFLHGS